MSQSVHETIAVQGQTPVPNTDPAGMPEKPNFFIIGAPKCGTTSLAKWIAEHPKGFVSSIKEPSFFNVDVGPRNVVSMVEYMALFDGSNDVHAAVGEASTSYLQSTVAVPTIISLFPRAKFIISIRNPVDMVASLHNQELKTFNEDILDLEEAWGAQSDRRLGKRIPNRCRDISLLFYKDRAMIGTQLEAVLRVVRKENLFIVVLDDLLVDPGNVYRSMLSFLNLEYDGRMTFSAENTSGYWKIPILELLCRRSFELKRRMGIKTKTGLFKHVQNWNTKQLVKKALSAGFKRRLVECFEYEVSLASKLVGRNFDNWLR